MPLNANSISAIIGGASNLANTLVSFGTQYALIDKQGAPTINPQAININIPKTNEGGIDFNIIIIALVIILLIFAVIFVTLKAF